MKNMFLRTTTLLFISFLFFSCQKNQDAPILTSIDPVFGPEETLITFEGMNLANIETMTFSGEIVNFNTAYNSDVALLFRIPESMPLGEHEVVITTPGGSVTTNFRKTKEAPEIFSLSPESGGIGEVITIKGKNFFEPLQVWFTDSVPANIVFHSPDSMEVEVPEGVEKGRITLSANGGLAFSPKQFFSVNPILINDFDGNGLRSETNKWIFRGSLNQNAMNAVQNSNPLPIDGNYLKVSGKDDLGIGWIGGPENNAADGFESYGITTTPNNTLFEMDIHNNGRLNTHVILILKEKDGSFNDFTHTIPIDKEGWRRISLPLNRFTDLDNVIVDPSKINIIKIHLVDENDSDEILEVNIDNLRFTEIL